jgi:hypothetical protein
MGVFKRFGDVVHQHTALFASTAGDVLIEPVVAEIANPDLKSPSKQDLKSPSYQDLILVSPGVGTRGSLNPRFFNICEACAGRCQDQVLA